MAGIHRIAGEEEMRALGRHLAADLRTGDVVALDGDLGAGKTQFVAGIAEAFGCQRAATSPTFTLVHEYHGVGPTLYHIDLYRIGSSDEAARAGISDLLPPDNGITLVEWASKFPDLIPPGARRVHITHDPYDPGLRHVTVAC